MVLSMSSHTGSIFSVFAMVTALDAPGSGCESAMGWINVTCGRWGYNGTVADELQGRTDSALA
jgi:hypothetical protein